VHIATIYFAKPVISSIMQEATKLSDELNEEIRKGRIQAHYINTPMGHFVGRAGEEAVFKMFSNRNIKIIPWFRDPYLKGKADIYLPEYKLRIEVKTWKLHQWRLLGRAIHKAQYERVKRKTDLIMWATIDMSKFNDANKFNEVCVMGFSTMDDFDKNKIEFAGDGKSWVVEQCKDLSELGNILKKKEEANA
jgi:hypothetical protein